MILKNHYVKWGVTAFCTVGSLLLFYDILFGSRALFGFLHQFLKASQPVLYGAAMAYLLAPVVNFFDGVAKDRLSKKPGTKGRQVSLGIRSVSILLTWLMIGALMYWLGSVLVPELVNSVTQLIDSFESYYNTVYGWIRHLMETHPMLESWLGGQIENYYNTVETWLETELLPQMTALMSIVSGGVFGVIGIFGDLLVGVIVSVYFLATKEACGAQARRVIYGLFSHKKVYWILRGVRKVDQVFAGFVRGKLLDSLIIGILCFIGCSLLNFPYTPLVSVFVGVTNVIPFFGPFLGAIPSIFLILLASPRQAVYFVIFVLALQQLDGNIIGPKILGDKTGLSSLWVIFAILVGGSFFGVAGMFFGVPVCACLYSAVNFYVDTCLRKKNLPVEVTSYVGGGPWETPNGRQEAETQKEP